MVPAAAALVALSACGGAKSGHTASTRAEAASVFKGGTATFALQPGNTPTYILPLVSAAYFTLVNEDEFEWITYRPLFWFGRVGTTTNFNPQQSLAYKPRFSVNPAGDTVAKVRLKPWVWSDGKPVTTRDVEFWMNLLEANKQDWGVYVPGAWPDIIKSIAYTSKTSFTIVFKRRYNLNWLLQDEMAQIFPLPQHVWDKVSTSSPVGNYDMTPAGARRVYKFLNAQSRDTSTYGSNPLWKVDDGPWILQSYNTGTGQTTLVRNPRYPGPRSGQVKRVVEMPYTSNSAEFTALKAGSLDVGYVPPSDMSAIPALEAQGYKIAPWWQWNVNFLFINFRNPTAGPIFKQLYVRQAMQSLIDQSAYIRQVYKGYAKPTYGPIPTTVANPFIAPQERANPYPYSVGRARRLLASHGWTVRPSGVTTCARPGTGAGKCGPGIRAGARLSLTLLYYTGNVDVNDEMQAIKSSFASAGIQVGLRQAPFTDVTSTVYGCNPAKPGTCGWQLVADSGWEYYPYPSGEELFKTGGSGNAGGYSNPRADRLIQATLTQPGLGPMRQYETYLEKDLPVLYLPTPAYQITAYKTGISGVLPQDPSLNIYPELWRAG